MKAAGRLLHVTPTGGICRFEIEPRMGQPVLDREGRRIGNVTDIFGPVEHPYVKIKPAKGIQLKELVGKSVFV